MYTYQRQRFSVGMIGYSVGLHTHRLQSMIL